ncbi:MAG: hypothetical protein JRN20_20065 [Nitrososphaerota archaeon]|nr:hypothetical protein [Nitrososphaerota archaeon]
MEQELRKESKLLAALRLRRQIHSNYASPALLLIDWLKDYEEGKLVSPRSHEKMIRRLEPP